MQEFSEVLHKVVSDRVHVTRLGKHMGNAPGGEPQ